MSVSKYLVGGAVRDNYLNKEVNDKDYVWVGVPVGYIEEHHPSFKLVGKDFPVYLDDEGNEVALARTERSTGRGYTDFECCFDEDVTLEEDLGRRDLTINSIAMDVDSLAVIDPYNGLADIDSKLLRHTTIAFKEDPIRVLRLARFQATFGSEWTIAPETKALCREMHKDGMLCNLQHERVWKELEKALKGVTPSLFLETLNGLEVFPALEQMETVPQRDDHHPEVWVGLHSRMVMDYAAKIFCDPEITFAGMVHDLGKIEAHERYGNAHGHEELGVSRVEDFCKEFKIPNNYRDLAVLVTRWHGKIHGVMGRGSNGWTTPKSIMKLFQETNALSKPERFDKILKACMADARGRGGTPEQVLEFESKEYPQYLYLTDCLDAAKAVDTKAISLPILQEGKKDGVFIGEQIRVARITAIRGVQNQWKQLKGRK